MVVLGPKWLAIYHNEVTELFFDRVTLFATREEMHSFRNGAIRENTAGVFCLPLKFVIQYSPINAQHIAFHVFDTSVACDVSSRARCGRFEGLIFRTLSQFVTRTCLHRCTSRF
jgi:hypothetical protein